MDNQFAWRQSEASNAALQRLAQVTTNKGYSPESPLQALVEWRGYFLKSQIESAIA